MKKTISLLLVLVMCLSLCACGGSKDNNNPQVLEAKDSTVRYENYRIEDNIIYLDFNYENRGKNASDIHDAVYIRAYQDGVELSDKYNEDSYTDILSGYNATYTYSFVLNSTESPVVIQYYSMGISKLLSEFTVDIATEK